MRYTTVAIPAKVEFSPYEPSRMKSGAASYSNPHNARFFYGWYIVAVGFLSHLVCAFHMSSTLSVFLKPLTEDLAVSRGLFSMMRSGEIVIGAVLAPFVGPLVDRYGGRWLMATGALVTGLGFVFLSQVAAFWQFLFLRWTLVTIGGVFMCHMVVTVTISRWFVRKRGRAIAIASLGQGSAKVAIPFFTAMLFALVGWRQTWTVFGLLTLVLVVIPALIFLRRSPEDMGLQPDGIDETIPALAVDSAQSDLHPRRGSKATDDVVWSRKEVLRSSAFWLICFTYGMANVGIAGLNLHVFAYVLDIGYPTIIAATVLSIIAMTQLGATLFWGFLTEKIDIRWATMLKFLTQGIGLAIATASAQIGPVYAGFFLYGIGLGGSWVLQELIWAHYFGRISLGMVRGLGVLVTHTFGAAGAPFFGFLFDATGSYVISFVLFIAALLVSAVLILFVRVPRK